MRASSSTFRAEVYHGLSTLEAGLKGFGPPLFNPTQTWMQSPLKSSMHSNNGDEGTPYGSFQSIRPLSWHSANSWQRPTTVSPKPKRDDILPRFRAKGTQLL